MLAGMMIVFEVFLNRGADPETLLSAETLQETKAQVMTWEEARTVGFSGVPDPAGKEVRLVAVAERDARWIERSLETSEAVTSFRKHEIR